MPNQTCPCREHAVSLQIDALLFRVRLLRERNVRSLATLNLQTQNSFIRRNPHENNHIAAWSLRRCCFAGRNASGRAVYGRNRECDTAAMNEATQGGAASPQDVQSQIRGGPTAAQQAEGARRPASDQLASAQSAL